MRSKNMHYCYNVEYFQDAMMGNGKKQEIYSQNNNYIYNFEFQDGSYLKSILEEEELRGNLKSFSLYTAYPGLFIGSGYVHDVKERNAIIGGFFFDYVTGLPVIPGSTLKGMLRSYFQKEKRGAVKELAKELRIELSGIDCDKLEENLFMKRDVYIGGFPVVNNGKKLLASEYITPHKDPFKNPVPLSLLKIRPGIEFKFVFLLYDYVETDKKVILSADKKAELYKALLELGGIGAKTNVGFGQFTRQNSSGRR